MINITLSSAQAEIVIAALANYGECMKLDFPACPDYSARAETARQVAETVEKEKQEVEITALMRAQDEVSKANKAKREASGNMFGQWKD